MRRLIRDATAFSNELLTWGHELRILGNMGAHPMDDEVTPDDATEAMGGLPSPFPEVARHAERPNDGDDIRETIPHVHAPDLRSIQPSAGPVAVVRASRPHSYQRATEWRGRRHL